MKTWIGLSLLLLALPCVFSSLCKKEGSNLYHYGPSHNDVSTPIKDDGASEEIHFLHPIKFLGKTYRSGYVCNNGLISFGEPVTSYTTDPFPLPLLNIICPFWADVDNKHGGMVWYRQGTDKNTLECLSADVSKLTSMKFEPVCYFMATWDAVHYHGSESNKTDTFQCVLASDKSKRTIVIFNYDEITLTTDPDSGGDPKTGLGGIAGQASFNTEKKSFNMPLSRSPHILNIATTSNVGHPGIWVFRIDDFIVPGGCIHKDSFMIRGQTAWIDEGCTQKCFCKHDGRVECEEQGCSEGLICLPSGRHFSCQINEEDYYVP